MKKGKPIVANVEDYSQMKISSPSQLGQLKTVFEKRLKEPELTEYKSSCFGHLLQVPAIKFQGQLVAHLLFHQDESRPSSKLLFHLQGKEARMGPEDFALITGLRFGSLKVPPNTSSFYAKVFGASDGPLVFESIDSEFKRYSEIEGEGPTTLKLAMLYTLYGVLICHGHSKKVDVQWIHLMDKLTRFNDFPWGRVAFDALASEIHLCMTTRLGLRNDKRRTNPTRKEEKFEISGFVKALQVWAYEILPCVVDCCAKKVEEASRVSPRLLRWTSDVQPRFKDLSVSCFPVLSPGDVGNAIVPLKPDYPETRSDYYRSVVSWKKAVEEDQAKNAGDAMNEGGSEDRKNTKKRRKEVVVEEFVKKEMYDKVVDQLEEQKQMLLWLMEKTGYSVADYMGDQAAPSSSDQRTSSSSGYSSSVSGDESEGGDMHPFWGNSPGLFPGLSAGNSTGNASDLPAGNAAVLTAGNVAVVSAGNVAVPSAGTEAVPSAGTEAVPFAAVAADLSAAAAADLSVAVSGNQIGAYLEKQPVVPSTRPIVETPTNTILTPAVGSLVAQPLSPNAAPKTKEIQNVYHTRRWLVEQQKKEGQGQP